MYINVPVLSTMTGKPNKNVYTLPVFSTMTGKPNKNVYTLLVFSTMTGTPNKLLATCSIIIVTYMRYLHGIITLIRERSITYVQSKSKQTY